jgi:hypothetical protein
MWATLSLDEARLAAFCNAKHGFSFVVFKRRTDRIFAGVQPRHSCRDAQRLSMFCMRAVAQLTDASAEAFPYSA